MRLIDADALIRFIDMGHLRSPYEKSFSDSEVVDMLETAPTVDIVRCADCKYSGAWFGHTMKCKRFHQLFDESFYCAFGEWVEE